MSRIDQIHNDYYDPDRYMGDGANPDEPDGKPPIHWAIRKMVRDVVGSDGVGQFYRAVYKGASCRPSIGFLINDKWYYCDDLYKFRESKGWPGPKKHPKMKEGSDRDRILAWERAVWDRRFWQVHTITAISVSSIVEGSDAEVPAVVIEGDEKRYNEVAKELWDALEEVNVEASRLWERGNTIWFCLSHDDHNPIYGRLSEFSTECEFYEGDEKLIPDEIVSLAYRLMSENWCNNCAEDAVELKDGWSVSAYELYD